MRKPIAEGKPNGTWRYVTLEVDGVPKMIGSFVYTAGQRTLFCPGFDCFIAPIENATQVDDVVVVDHITLEPPKFRNGNKVWSSHVATVDQERNNPRGLQQSSREVDGYMFPWFSLIIPGFSLLEDLPKELFIPHQVPSSTLPNGLERTLGKYMTPIVLKTAEPSLEGSFFIQLDVWISKCQHPGTLQSCTFNYIASVDEETSRENRLTGKNEFALIEGQFWVRILSTLRSGLAERVC
ncbi:MAG: hypothetical protein ACE5FZ_10010, partial [Nitrospiria bacterium]